MAVCQLLRIFGGVYDGSFIKFLYIFSLGARRGRAYRRERPAPCFLNAKRLMAQYLDTEGLTTLWARIKKLFYTKEEADAILGDIKSALITINGEDK